MPGYLGWEHEGPREPRGSARGRAARRRRARSAALLLTGLWCLAGVVLGAQADPLVRAHELYNQHQYDEAIRAATDAGHLPATENAAGVVLARAHLERYRQDGEAADLDSARAALSKVVDAKLSARDRVDWSVGLGEVLFFDRRFSTAAEFFDAALAHADLLEAGAREPLLEWWASALDQQAQTGPDVERRAVYARLLARAESELQEDDQSAVASYWLAAAALGADDLDRAWAAVEAGWLRGAGTAPERVKLRVDLDRLMTLALIPARARHFAPTGDPHAAVAQLQKQWDDLKRQYGQQP